LEDFIGARESRLLQSLDISMENLAGFSESQGPLNEQKDQ